MPAAPGLRRPWPRTTWKPCSKSLRSTTKRSKKSNATPKFEYLLATSRECWDEAIALGKKHGYRNAQVTVLAPTGTISFFMDSDTTGIEPDIALVKYKILAGGGNLKIVNQTVPEALTGLGYKGDEIRRIIDHIEAYDTIEDVTLTAATPSSNPARGKRVMWQPADSSRSICPCSTAPSRQPAERGACTTPRTSR